jgi:hypothetical protein
LAPHAQDDIRMAQTTPVLVPDGSQECVVRVHSVHRTPMERILVVLGSIEAEIGYDYTGVGERVFVNGELAARSYGFAIPAAPRFKFHLRGRARRVPALVEVSAYWRFWRGIKKFRLVVGDTVIYEEIKGRITIPADRTNLLVRDGTGPTLLSILVGR